MTHPNAPQPAVGPRATHYVSLINGGIYPAQTGLPGHEDANPSDWRPATPQEVSRYRAGQQQVDVSPLQLTDAPPVSPITPSSIQLADDDIVTPVAEAPVVAPVVPMAPAAAPFAPAPVAGIPPAPTAE